MNDRNLDKAHKLMTLAGLLISDLRKQRKEMEALLEQAKRGKKAEGEVERV